MNYASVLALLSGLILIVLAMLFGGTAKSFLNLPSFLIVVGGTFAVTLVSFSPGELLRAFGFIAKVVRRRLRDPGVAARAVMALAERARREGVLSLQSILNDPNQEEFLLKAIGMAVDGTPGEDLERILRRELAANAQHQHESAGIFRRAADISPAMGLIGTLIGLIQMLANLNDPTTIGPAMAVALLTTFYGAVLATMVFTPIASKLERSSDEETLLRSVYLLGAASIGRKENPRRLEMLLNTVLPPMKRITYYE